MTFFEMRKLELRKIKCLSLGVSLVAQQIKYPALSLLWREFNPWPRNFHMPWVLPLTTTKKIPFFRSLLAMWQGWGSNPIRLTLSPCTQDHIVTLFFFYVYFFGLFVFLGLHLHMEGIWRFPG